MTRHTEVAIIGGGQAGLAMSRRLALAGVDHLILERGRIGERWRSERWPSLRLLTPNWMTRLPDLAARFPDPDGFMPASAFTGLLEGYAAQHRAPILTEREVIAVRLAPRGFEIATTAGALMARAVVVATGACDRPNVPAWARALSPRITQITTDRYAGPDALDPGGVLVVGASATGVQLAREIHASGRSVTLAVGRHVRTPRRYRGRDIYAWMDASGFLTDPRGDLPAARLRSQPSFQLVGDAQGRSLGLHELAAEGVRIVGRAQGAAGETVFLADDLPDQCAAAEARRRKVLRRIDDFIVQSRLATAEEPEAWAAPPELPAAATAIRLGSSGIRTVLWATGYRRSYPWLHIPVLDEAGEIRNEGGLTPVPGLYVLGLPFMRHRASALIDGVGRDAVQLSHAIVRDLAGRLPAAA